MNFIELFTKRKQTAGTLDPSKIGRKERRYITRLLLTDLAEFADFQEWLNEKDPGFCETLKRS